MSIPDSCGSIFSKVVESIAKDTPNRATILTANCERDLANSYSALWKSHLDTLSIQSKFKDVVALEPTCRVWNRIISSLPSGQLSFMLRASADCLPTPLNLRRWKYITDPKCKLCSLPTPTTLHILNNCQTALVQGRYTWRHDSVLKQIVQRFRNVLSEGQALYADLPGFLANTSPPVTIPLNLSSTSDRPDLVIISPDEIGILELTVCYNAPSNLEAAKKRKMDKYAALVADLESGSTLVTYVTLEIGCLGRYTKDAVKSLQLLLPSMTKREIMTLLTSLSKIAISCSKSIFQAQDHPTWISSTPLYSP